MVENLSLLEAGEIDLLLRWLRERCVGYVVWRTTEQNDVAQSALSGCAGVSEDHKWFHGDGVMIDVRSWMVGSLPCMSWWQLAFCTTRPRNLSVAVCAHRSLQILILQNYMSLSPNEVIPLRVLLLSSQAFFASLCVLTTNEFMRFVSMCGCVASCRYDLSDEFVKKLRGCAGRRFQNNAREQ